MKIERHRLFRKGYKKLPRQVQLAFQERVALFVQNKYDPILHNHALSGEYLGKRSFNVTGDYRVIFVEQEDLVVLYLIGTHSELYGK